jgi:DNA anti-recombination protein RmuC
MNKKMGTLQQREVLLQENRAKRVVLQDENNELKRKVHELEVRLDEIAQVHSIAVEETKLRDKEVKTLQDELTSISSEFTRQREEIEREQDTIKV